LRIAIISSEVVPFAKTGGLADVAGALPKALGERDVDARVILPLYQQIDRSVLSDSVIADVPVEWRGQILPTRVYQSDAAGAPAYLIDAPEYFSKPSRKTRAHRSDKPGVRRHRFGKRALAVSGRATQPARPQSLSR